MKRLARAAINGFVLDVHGDHGPLHWLRVRANGLALADRTPGADAEVVELFALLHDSKRQDEWRDLEHGERAASFVRELKREGALWFSTTRVELLAAACAGHHHPRISGDPTVGCCWDADRLDLSRLGARPREQLLSTKASRDAELQSGAWKRGVETEVEVCGLAAWGMA